MKTEMFRHEKDYITSMLDLLPFEHAGLAKIVVQQHRIFLWFNYEDDLRLWVVDRQEIPRVMGGRGGRP